MFALEKIPNNFFSDKSFTSHIQMPPVWSVSYFPSVWLRKEPVFGASVVVLVLYNERYNKEATVVVLVLSNEMYNKVKIHFSFQLSSHFVGKDKKLGKAIEQVRLVV